MTRRKQVRKPAIILAALAPTLAFASFAGAGDSPSAVPEIFRLGKGTMFQEGCFPPCLCPIFAAASVQGTFTLTPDGFDGSFELFNVDDVNWTVQFGDSERRITGSGTYRIGQTDDSAQPLHRLELDLRVGEDKTEHFDSGLLPVGDESTFEIAVSINGMWCWDRVIVIEAAPVPPQDVRPYRLVRGSTYQHGCWDPCDCPIGPELGLLGTFDLVRLEANPFFSEFAVVNVRLRVPGPVSADPISIGGFGTYRIQAEFAVQNEMGLDLIVDDAERQHFGSGLVVGGFDFPRIDVVVSINGMFCLDTVLHLVAVPRHEID